MKLSRAVVAFVGLALCVIGNAFCSARAQTTRRGYILPARHFASTNTSVYLPPKEMRVR
jgi:hypothetical protein